MLIEGGRAFVSRFVGAMVAELRGLTRLTVIIAVFFFRVNRTPLERDRAEGAVGRARV